MIYDDKIVEPMKDPSNVVGASSTSVLSAKMKTYFDEQFRKILVDNQIKDERIMSRINGLTKEREDRRANMQDELKAHEARVTIQVDFVRVDVDYLGRSNVIFNIGPSYIDSDPTDHVLDVIGVVPYSDDATAFP